MASVISLVEACPPISLVKIPAPKVASTASSIRLASSYRPKLSRNIIATDKIIEIGLAIPRPAISGAEP